MIPVRTLLVVAALTLAFPASAAAAADGACPSLDDGVTVVVDFQHLGGGVVTRCAPGDPESGLAALAAVGFRVDQVANQPGFVCRIDGLPGPDDEDCADTPPANAYWGYSHADRGGSWSYSGSGAHVSDPSVGTVEGWAFNGGGGSSQPTVPPPPEPEPEPGPEPEPESEPQPSPTGDGTTHPDTGSVPATSTGSPSQEDRGTPSQGRSDPQDHDGETPATPPTPAAGVTATPSDAPEPPAAADDVPTESPSPSTRAAATTDAGSPLPTAAAVLAVAALVGVGVTLHRRRERGGTA